MPACRLSAGWVLPVGAEPIPQAAVLIDPEGRIARVGPDLEVPRPAGVPEVAVPEAAIVPGLINTHTHLELTGLAGQVEDDDFTTWIRRLRELKALQTPDAFLAAARAGLRDCWATGVTMIADTGDSGATIQALHELGGSGVVYHEVFGPHPNQCAASLAALQRRVAELGRFTSPRVRLGVSPHAPYTVSGPLYQATAAWARAEGLPLAVHLAESPAESALIAEAAGPFAEAWERRGIPRPALPGRSPVAWLEQHGVLGADTLCIHVVQVDGADIATLARAGAAVAHCPLSNRRHGHGDAPLTQLRAAGLRVGIGTDSVVSVGRLDLLAEVRAARHLAELSAEAALELATLAGARALGLEDEIGSVVPGKWGDLTVIRIGPATAAGAAVERVLQSESEDVVATYIGGRQAYRNTRS